jgi:hypothetical protein
VRHLFEQLPSPALRSQPNIRRVFDQLALPRLPRVDLHRDRFVANVFARSTLLAPTLSIVADAALETASIDAVFEGRPSPIVVSFAATIAR